MVAPDDARCFILLTIGVVNIILLYLIEARAVEDDKPLWNRTRGTYSSIASILASFAEIGTINDAFVFTVLCYVIAGLLPLIDIYFKVNAINQLREAHRISMSQLMQSDAKMREGLEQEKSVKARQKQVKNQVIIH